jgi:hypothetical protein
MVQVILEAQEKPTQSVNRKVITFLFEGITVKAIVGESNNRLREFIFAYVSFFLQCLQGQGFCVRKTFCSRSILSCQADAPFIPTSEG